MGTITDLLHPGESVIMQQRIDVPTGDLYLTNMRLIFRRLGKLGGKDIQIPLQNIKRVWKSFVLLKVQANQEYEFMVNIGPAGKWVTAIQHAHQRLTQPSTFQPRGSPQPSVPQTMDQKPCTSCGAPLVYVHKYSRYYCNNCQQYV